MSVPATFFLGAAQALDIDFLNPSANDYAIVTSGSTSPVITPDSVLSLEYKGESRIGDFPIEQGGFSSFNKVDVPFDIRMVMACGGQNYLQSALQTVTQTVDTYVNSVLGTAFGQPMTRADFLAQLKLMRKSLDLYDIVTPDETYMGVNLVHYDYAKKNDNGAVMIIAECWFREIRQTVSASYSTSSNTQVNSNSPSAASQVSTGTASPTTGTTAQQAIAAQAPLQ